MKSFPPPRTKAKKEELKTYQELGMNRTLKSRFKRALAERSGVHQVIGGRDRPYLQVSKERYRTVRLEVMREFLEQARDLRLKVPAALLLQQLQARIENTTYDRLAVELQQGARLESAFLRHHGRSPVHEEKIRFGESMPAAGDPLSSFRGAHHGLIDGLLNKLQSRQIHNPARYQTAWAQAVGTDHAQHSQLEKVDTIQGVAYFRCFNSVLSHQLQRQDGVARKLSQALGLSIRCLRICH